MPYRRKRFRKKRFNKRRRRRYGKRRKINRVIVRGPTGIPDKLLVRLVYADQISITTGIPGKYVFRGNSIFDPDLTGVGHQPRFFDQYSQLYERYRVHASKINIKLVNASPNVSGLGVVPLTQSTSTELNSIVDLQEAPYVKFRWLQNGSNPTVTSITSFMKTSVIRGEKDEDDDYSAQFVANPTRMWYWHIIAAESDNSPPTVNSVVKITYYVEFFRRRIVSQS